MERKTNQEDWDEKNIASYEQKWHRHLLDHDLEGV